MSNLASADPPVTRLEVPPGPGNRSPPCAGDVSGARRAGETGAYVRKISGKGLLDAFLSADTHVTV